MKTGLIQLLYNPGSITTCGANEEAPTIPYSKTEVVKLNQNDEKLLSALEVMITAGDEKNTAKTIKKFGQELEGNVSPGLVPVVLGEFNKYMARLSERFSLSRHVYLRCLGVVMVFRRHIELSSSANGCVIRENWVELEKAFYLLSVWEARVELNACLG